MKIIARSGENGFHTYRIPGITVTDQDTILLVYECRITQNDFDTRAIALHRSTDGGVTWEDRRLLVHGDMTVNNPVLLSCSHGIFVFYCIDYFRNFYMVSHDDGITFSAPAEITHIVQHYQKTYPYTVSAFGPGHGIELSDGRLVVPMWLAKGAEFEYRGRKYHYHAPAVSTILIYDPSKQDGFSCGEIIGLENPELDLNECSAAELSDGSVMLNCRSTGSRCRVVSVSPDGACNWSAARRDENLIDPVCFGSIASNGGILAFCNCESTEAREKLTVKFSYDDGLTWEKPVPVCKGSAAYADIFFSRDAKNLYIFYEAQNYSELIFNVISV